MSSRLQHHAHPVSILQNLYQVLYLLLIPLIRGFLSALQGGFRAWLSGAWLDILVLALFLGVGILQWARLTFSYDREGIHLQRGVLYRERLFIPMERISTLSMLNLFYLKPLGAVHLRADVPGGSHRDSDFSLTVSRRVAANLMATREKARNPEPHKAIYIPRSVYIALLSLFTSNSLAGVLFLSTLISQTGRLLGEEFAEGLFGTFETLARRLAFGIPPAAAALGYLLLFGYLLAFCVSILRHSRFLVERHQNTMYIRYGMITNRYYSLGVQDINYLDIRQSLFAKILGFSSVFLHVVGYGRQQKQEISVLVPAGKNRESSQIIRGLLPHLKPSDITIRSGWISLPRFLTDPAVFCLGIPLLSYLLALFFPEWGDFIHFVGWMLLIPALWFLAVRLVDCATSGISKEGKNYTIRYSSGYYLHKVVIPEEKISQISLRQSIFQRLNRRCDLLLYTYGEVPKPHLVRNLPQNQVLALFGLHTTLGKERRRAKEKPSNV